MGYYVFRFCYNKYKLHGKSLSQYTVLCSIYNSSTGCKEIPFWARCSQDVLACKQFSEAHQKFLIKKGFFLLNIVSSRAWKVLEFFVVFMCMADSNEKGYIAILGRKRANMNFRVLKKSFRVPEKFWKSPKNLF